MVKNVSKYDTFTFPSSGIYRNLMYFYEFDRYFNNNK